MFYLNRIPPRCISYFIGSHSRMVFICDSTIIHYLCTYICRDFTDYIRKKKEEKEQRFKMAEERGELLECPCCYDDKVLFEDMQACPEGHIFCQECISRSAEAALSEAKANFRCLQGECELEFSHKVLQMVLPVAKFSILLRRVQEEEIRQADIPNLVACPFCSFATIMNEEDGKVLHCLNPECLKESCR